MLRTHHRMGKVGRSGVERGGEKKNVPDDFMVPLQIFSMCCSREKKRHRHGVEWLNTLASRTYTKQIFHIAFPSSTDSRAPPPCWWWWRWKYFSPLPQIHPHPPSYVSPLSLLLLLFYYLFYDCIKWPIVKVNDSQRHKTAHFLLWLLSIILFNDKLGLDVNIFASLSGISPVGSRRQQRRNPTETLMPPSVYFFGAREIFKFIGGGSLS